MRTPSPLHEAVRPNLLDYDAECSGFSWQAAASRLGLTEPGASPNIAWLATERQVRLGRGEKVALRWLGKAGDRTQLRYGELTSLVRRFAAALRELGIGPGEGVFLLMGRIPALHVTALGALANRCIVCPLFSAFGPQPIRDRMTLGAARVLVTTEALYAKKIRELRSELPGLAHVIVVCADPAATPPAGTLSWHALVESAPEGEAWAPTAPGDPALLHFTSGTTGAPKGALHVHEAVVMHHYTARAALDLHDEDVFWCTADPGWVTGTSYGIIAPLTCGVTLVVDEADFDAERWYATLERERVTVWYTAPTAIRRLIKAGPELARAHDLSRVRFMASVGEPLDAEAVVWGRHVLGRPFHDNWWQTETGGIMIANLAALEVRPGSMGKPLPGVTASVVRRTGSGVEPVPDGTTGELALRPGWPSMFRAYVGAPERYQECFAGGWYLSGDLVRRDRDGWYWFVGRADDLIKSAGHLIGPFEVEAVLLEHPAVAEAGVIGKPDPVAREIVKAFIGLAHGYAPSPELQQEILAFARKRLGPAVAPREVAFVADLPRTRSGKILRRLLKARELGWAEGDLSTLEAGA